MIPSDFTVPAFQRVPWKRFRNQNSETCPVGAVMRVTDTVLVDGEIVALCDKPDSTRRDIYLVNTGPHSVPQYNASSKPEGTCAPLTHHAGIVLYDDSAGTPVFGEYWGPENDSWLLTNSTSLGNFLVMGGLQTAPARLNAMQLQSTALTSTSRLVARLESSATILDRWSYASPAAPYDLIGRQYPLQAYGNGQGALVNHPALPTAAAEIYRIGDDGTGQYKYIRIDDGIVVNPTPWKYYGAAVSQPPFNFDEDLLLVEPHDNVYVVTGPLSWKPRAVFRATSVNSSFLEWTAAPRGFTATIPYAGNRGYGDIAEPNNSVWIGGIRMLAPGVRAYEIDVEITLTIPGITAADVQITTALPTSFSTPLKERRVISAGNFTNYTTTLHYRGLVYASQGDDIWTSLQVVPAVSISVSAIMIIKPWSP